MLIIPVITSVNMNTKYQLSPNQKQRTDQSIKHAEHSAIYADEKLILTHLTW